jgi:hypothetical protein
VRYFLTGRLPAVHSILLVESGSREILEKVIPGLRQTWGPEARIDLVSCFAALPAGLDPATTRVFRVGDYRGSGARRKLYRELSANRYALLGTICSEEPVMFKWKCALLWQVPAKVFVINENGDYFWLDRKHLKLIREFVLLRSGLGGAGAVRTLARLVCFPFTFLFLLLYATAVHARRALRRG